MRCCKCGVRYSDPRRETDIESAALTVPAWEELLRTGRCYKWECQRVTALDFMTLPHEQFVIGVFSTNDRQESERIMTEVLSIYAHALKLLAKEARELCQRDHVCSHRKEKGDCLAAEPARTIAAKAGLNAQCNRNDLDWAVERVLHDAAVLYRAS